MTSVVMGLPHGVPCPEGVADKLKKLGLAGWRDPHAARDSSDQRIGMAREGSGFSAELRGGAVDSCVSWRLHYHSCATGRRLAGEHLRSLARFFIAALIGVGATFVLRSHGDEAKEMIRSWAASLG